jgi:hypothetical protein
VALVLSSCPHQQQRQQQRQKQRQKQRQQWQTPQPASFHTPNEASSQCPEKNQQRRVGRRFFT